MAIAVIFSFDPSCKKENEKCSEKEILSFAIEEQVESTAISSKLAAVTFLVPDSVDPASIIPEITTSEKATIKPSSDKAVDYSQGDVIYTVTAEDNTTKVWCVSVVNKLSIEAEILSLRLAMFQVGDAIFDGQDIYIEVYYGVNPAALNPIIEISENASLSRGSNRTTDFSSGSVLYTVTARMILKKHEQYMLVTP